MVYKFLCRLCNGSYYGECDRTLAERSSEHIGISPLTNKKVKKPREDSPVCDHLINCNYSHTFDDFSVLCLENKKYFLVHKESLRIMRNTSSMNRNIRSAHLCLFE